MAIMPQDGRIKVFQQQFEW